MSLVALLERAKGLGVQLRLEGDKLKLLAPPGALTPELRASLAERKAESISFLQGAAQAPRISPRETGPVPASSGQERLWLLEQLEPNTSRYHLHFGLRIHGALRYEALREGLQELLRRYEILRTSLQVVDGELRQIISDRQELALPIVDLRSLPEAERERALPQRSLEQAKKPFDLERGPLLRASLLILRDEEHLLLVTQHHAISDAWSLITFCRELGQLYEASSRGLPSPLPPPTLQYADMALWQRRWLAGEESQRQRAYWRKRLEGLPTLELPVDKRPAARTSQGATAPVRLSGELSARLKELAHREGTTLFTVLLSGFAALLSRYSGQTDFGVGTVMANRGREELAPLLGFFANTLVLRCDLADDPSLTALLRRTHALVLEAQENQELPFDEIVRAVGATRGGHLNPLIQTCFVMESFPLGQAELPSLRWSPYLESPDGATPGTAKFDLGLTLAEADGGIWGAFEYSTDLFAPKTVERMAGHLTRLLEGLVEDPAQRVSALPLLPAQERHQLLVEWNATQAEFPKACLHELIEAQVERSPEATAVLFEGESLSYRELNERANRLAHHLRALGVGPEVLVGLCLERSLEMVVGILATLKAGGAYVPIEPTYPRERVAFLLKDSGVPVLFTQEELKARLPESTTRVLCLDSEAALFSSEPSSNPSSGALPQSLAYIIYTSGSTGAPKGAGNTHRGVVNRLHWMQKAFRLRAEDRVLQKTPFGFDVSVWEFLWPLQVGATLVVAKPEGHKDPAYLLDLIEAQEITTLHFVPSMFAAFLEALSPGRARSLRRVICSGEELPRELVERFFLRSGAELHNLYGPTEAAIDVTAYRCSPGETGPVPIGRPSDNLSLYLLDTRQQLVPRGVPGELYISGVGLARGYLSRPELTRERFLPDPFSEAPNARMYRTGDLCRYRGDGNLEFLGRLDHQVKLRGHRIELGEIEAVLCAHPAVKSCVVVAREEAKGEKRLVAYLVPQQEPPEQAELWRHLRAKLPEYMIPSAFVVLAALPLSANGKVDRRALPAPEPAPEHRDAVIPPRTRTEEELLRLWEDLLPGRPIGVRDDLFSLGGHSLLAARLLTRVQASFGRAPSLAQLFQSPTIEALASLLDGAAPAPSAPDLWAEALLDADISCEDALPMREGEPSHILLTGATGFLGAFLLHELLDRTSARILCLVRSRSREEARARIREALSAYSLWREELGERIIPLAGDLAEPRLGLSAEEFHRLAAEVDVIYHNGALVNFSYPYERLRASNVGGTREVLRLACRERLKPLHYVSTVSVFPLERGAIHLEKEEPDRPELLYGGYSQSKWVAERLVLEARRRGLPIAVYRPGRVTGHSKTGIFNPHDIFCYLVRACIQLGKIPDDEAQLVDMTPVDFASQAIVCISRDAHCVGGNYHISNPAPVRLGEMIEHLSASGYSLSKVPLNEWLHHLEGAAREATDPFFQVLPSLFKDVPTEDLNFNPQVDCRNTLEELRGKNIFCPPADGVLLSTYKPYLVGRVPESAR